MVLIDSLVTSNLAARESYPGTTEDASAQRSLSLCSRQGRVWYGSLLLRVPNAAHWVHTTRHSNQKATSLLMAVLLAARVMQRMNAKYDGNEL